MPTVKRALLYIRRKPGKTILLLLLFFVISLLILTGMVIYNAAEGAAARVRESIGGYFKITSRHTTDGVPQFVDGALVDAVLGREGIKGHNSMDTLYLATSSRLKPARFTAENDSKASLARFLGNTDSSLHEYFILDILSLEEGRHIAPGDHRKAVVSRAFAEMNGLELGDTVLASITEDAAPGSGALGTEYGFEIAGIFGETNAKQAGVMTAECDLPANFIFIDEESGREIAAAMSGGDGDRYHAGASFFVNDPKELDAIAADVLQLPGIDWDSYELTKSNAAYQKAMAPLTRLGGMTFMMVAVIAITGMVLISLLLVMWTRDRVHEAGVLMSVGIRKSGIFFQHLAECTLIFLIAFAAAWGVSVPVSERVGGMLYRSTLTEVREEPAEREHEPWDMEPAGLDEAGKAAEFTVRPSAEAVAAACAVGISLVVVSEGLGFLVILRKRPKDLLTIME